MSHHPDTGSIDLEIAALCEQLQGLIRLQADSSRATHAKLTLEVLVRKLSQSAQLDRPALPESSPVKLYGDVAEILARPDLVALIGQGREIIPSKLRQAWNNLGELNREIFRWHYQFDGHPKHQSFVKIGKIVNRTDTGVSYLHKDTLARLEAALWPTHEFQGLKTKVRNLLLDGGMRTIDDLPDDILPLLSEPGWGPGALNSLDDWLVGKGRQRRFSDRYHQPRRVIAERRH